MMKTKYLYQVLICVLLSCGCSVEMDQAGETPQVENTPVISSTSIFPVTRVPVTWAHLHLTGKLVYLSSTMEGEQLTSTIQVLDLVTGEIKTILSVPRAWIYYATVSPDAKFLAISYAPPKQSNSPASRSLYMVQLDSPGEPQPILAPSTADDHYTQVEWSPDGKYIYFVHYNSKVRHPGQLDPVYNIFRTKYPDGQPEKIAGDSFWPRLSSDSSKLVYISVDPVSAGNELVVTNFDGSDAQPIALTGSFIPDIIDAPVFAPDGQSILFSAPEPTQSYQPNFFERLMGIQIAKAHDVPSDWWSVSVSGGAPARLTNLHTINLFASLSPDGRHVASLSGDGIFVMDLTGSNLTRLVSDSGVHGTVSWIP